MAPREIFLFLVPQGHPSSLPVPAGVFNSRFRRLLFREWMNWINVADDRRQRTRGRGVECLILLDSVDGRHLKPHAVDE